MSRQGSSVQLAVLGLAMLPLGCGGGSPAAPAGPPAAGSPPVVTVASEGWVHVAEGTPVTYQANPPASGPHYPVWARYKEHAQAVPRPYWVHNLEHGAIVLLYRPDAPSAAVAELRQAFSALPNDSACGHRRALLTPDPLLPQPVAAVAAFHVLTGERLDPSWVRSFTDTYRGQGPEAECADGSVG